MSRANLSGPGRRRLRAGWVSIVIEQVDLFVKVGTMETNARAFHSHPAWEASGPLITAHAVTRRRARDRAGRSVQPAGCGAGGAAGPLNSPGRLPRLPELGPVPGGSSGC